LRDQAITLLKVVISLGLLLFLLYRFGLDQVGRILAQANYGLLLIALLLYFITILLSAGKWYVLWRTQDSSVPYSTLLGYYFIGLFFNNFLPIVGQDVVRGYDLARHTERGAEAAVSVVVDRLVGLSAFGLNGAALLLVAVFVVGRSDLLHITLVASAVALAILALFASVLSRRLRALAERVFQLPGFKVGLPVYRKLSAALVPYRHSYGALVIAFLLSTSSLAVSNVVNLLLSESVGAGIPLFYIFVFNPLIAFAPVIIPSLGGIGVNQGAYEIFYSALAHSTTPPLAFATGLMIQFVIIMASLPWVALWWRQRGVRIPRSLEATL